MILETLDNSKEKYLNTEDAGLLIGRSPGAIRNLVMRRKIPFRKSAGRLLFIESEIRSWIEDAPGVTLEQLKNNSN